MSATHPGSIKVLFVCLGNICRSPMAESVFAHKVQRAGLQDKIMSDSAGTGSWHAGELPHPGTLRLLAEKGIACVHRARHLKRADLDLFDYILTMDNDNLQEVRALGGGKAVVRPLLDYAPGLKAAEVPDPYYNGNFSEVYRLVDPAADGLLVALRESHNL